MIERLEEWTRVPVAPWVAWVAFGLVLTGGLLLKRVLFGLLHRVTARTPTQLDDLLVKRMGPAGIVFVLVVASHAALRLRGTPFPGVDKVLALVELLLVAYLAIETAETLVFDWWLGERRKLHVPEVVRQVVLVVLYLGALLAILASVGFDVTPILATSTVLSVARSRTRSATCSPACRCTRSRRSRWATGSSSTAWRARS